MSVSSSLKDNFVSGLILALPFVVVLIVLQFLVKYAFLVIDPVVESTRLVQYTSNNELLAQVIAAALIFTLLSVLGFLYTHQRTKGLLSYIGRFANFIPLLGSIYLSVRQVASSVSDNESKFKKLVLLEYPREDVYSIGLLTSKSPSEFRDKASEELYSVYLPNSPNPTNGRTVMIPESDLIELDMSVQKGLKLMMTTGMSFEEELPEELKENKE